MQLPEIKIQHGYLLESLLTPMYREWKQDPNWASKTHDEVLKIIEQYQNAWDGYEKTILEEVQDIANLTFRNPFIDVYIVSSMRGGTSKPCVIASYFEPDLFVDVLTHELLHIILSDNTQEVSVRNTLNEMYPTIENRKIKNHIVLHAIHKKLYLEVMSAPERLVRDQKRCERWKDHKHAWDIVEEKGYNEIIEEFKSHY